MWKIIVKDYSIVFPLTFYILRNIRIKLTDKPFVVFLEWTCKVGILGCWPLIMFCVTINLISRSTMFPNSIFCEKINYLSMFCWRFSNIMKNNFPWKKILCCISKEEYLEAFNLPSSAGIYYCTYIMYPNT